MGAAPQSAAIVSSAVKATMDNAFLKIINSQKEFQNTYDLIEAAFQPDLPLSEKQIDSLKKLKAPKIYSVKEGLAFQFGESQGFKISLNSSLNSVEDQDLNPQSSYFLKVPLMLMTTSAQAQLLPAILIGGVALARIFIVAGARKLLIQAALGASLGCAYEMQKGSGDKTAAEACKVGALEGSTFLLGGVGLGRIWKSALGGSRIAQIAIAAGLTAGIALVGNTAVEIATLNSSVIRCNGSKGDYILSARVNGLTGRTLYESSDNQILFYLPGKSGTTEVAVNREAKALIDFFVKQNKFPEASEATLKDASKQVLAEVANFRKDCATHGDGYTKRLWSSEGQELQKPKISTPAVTPEHSAK